MAKRLTAASGRHCFLFIRFSYLIALLCEVKAETNKYPSAKYVISLGPEIANLSVLCRYRNSAYIARNVAGLGHAVEVDRDSDIWVGIGVTHVCPWNTNRRLPHHAFLECLFDFAVLYGSVVLPDVASLEKLPLHIVW